MLANSLDYFRRESKQFWWEHFDRLHQPLDEWVTTRDVFLVESAAVVTDWQVPEGRARNARRQVRLVGDWTPGSTPTAQANVVYAARSLPATATGELRWPPGANGPDTARYGTRKASEVANDPDCPDDARVLLLTESCSIDDCYDDLPVALAPAAPHGQTSSNPPSPNWPKPPLPPRPCPSAPGSTFSLADRLACATAARCRCLGNPTRRSRLPSSRCSAPTTRTSRFRVRREPARPIPARE